MHPEPWNATRIRALRESQGWNQEGLARQIAWSARSVWRWEQGEPPSTRARDALDQLERVVLEEEEAIDRR